MGDPCNDHGLAELELLPIYNHCDLGSKGGFATSHPALCGDKHPSLTELGVHCVKGPRMGPQKDPKRPARALGPKTWNPRPTDPQSDQRVTTVGLAARDSFWFDSGRINAVHKVLVIGDSWPDRHRLSRLTVGL